MRHGKQQFLLQYNLLPERKQGYWQQQQQIQRQQLARQQQQQQELLDIVVRRQALLEVDEQLLQVQPMQAISPMLYSSSRKFSQAALMESRANVVVVTAWTAFPISGASLLNAESMSASVWGHASAGTEARRGPRGDIGGELLVDDAGITAITWPPAPWAGAAADAAVG